MLKTLHRQAELQRRELLFGKELRKRCQIQRLISMVLVWFNQEDLKELKRQGVIQ